MQTAAIPIFLLVACTLALTAGLLLAANTLSPRRPGRVKAMPYESGMDPIHDTRRRFDVRFYLVAIAFLVFDVELLFLYPWAVSSRPVAGQPSASAGGGGVAEQAAPGIDAAVSQGLVENRDIVFAGAMVFLVLLTLGFIYDWRKGVFQWR